MRIVFTKNINLPCWPIVLGMRTLTQHISASIDRILKHWLPTIHSYIKDITNFFQILQKPNKLPNDSLLVTIDEISLYSNIPHNKGIHVCRNFLSTSGFHAHNIQDICNIIKFMLTHNNFEFNGCHFLQVRGTAMGSKMAPSYGNMFMDALEWNILSRYYLEPLHLHRYIDNIFYSYGHIRRTLSMMYCLNTSTIFRENCSSNSQWSIQPLAFCFLMYWYV